MSDTPTFHDREKQTTRWCCINPIGTRWTEDLGLGVVPKVGDLIGVPLWVEYPITRVNEECKTIWVGYNRLG